MLPQPFMYLKFAFPGHHEKQSGFLTEDRQRPSPTYSTTLKLTAANIYICCQEHTMIHQYKIVNAVFQKKQIHELHTYIFRACDEDREGLVWDVLILVP